MTAGVTGGRSEARRLLGIAKSSFRIPDLGEDGSVSRSRGGEPAAAVATADFRPAGSDASDVCALPVARGEMSVTS